MTFVVLSQNGKNNCRHREKWLSLIMPLATFSLWAGYTIAAWALFMGFATPYGIQTKLFVPGAVGVTTCGGLILVMGARAGGRWLKRAGRAMCSTGGMLAIAGFSFSVSIGTGGGWIGIASDMETVGLSSCLLGFLVLFVERVTRSKEAI